MSERNLGYTGYIAGGGRWDINNSKKITIDGNSNGNIICSSVVANGNLGVGIDSTFIPPHNPGVHFNATEDISITNAKLLYFKIKGIDNKEMADKHYDIMKSTIAKISSQIDKDIQYNGAFSKSVEIFGEPYFASKIYEKTMRIIHLTKGNESSFESLEDSLEDCMGYCMLALAEIRRKKGVSDNGNS